MLRSNPFPTRYCTSFRGSEENLRPLEELESQPARRLPEYLRRQTGWTENQVARALEQSATPADDDLPPGVDDALRTRLLPFAPFLRLEDTIPGGHLYVASESGLRKAQGVYYTPKWITSFIVERTLEPLVYDGEGESRRVKPPRELLALKVCDPAMGSGAFLVQACRYLGERLAESWDLAAAAHPAQVLTLPYAVPLAENPLGQPFPDDHAEAVAWARRFVAEHCLYGVDINPLAVELAKLSLWLVTLAKDRPFEFLDHKLKPGNSLIGCRAADFVADHDLHPALPGVFRHLDTLHMHQALAVEALQHDRHLIVATGTGSGKTEAFLLPIINHCLRLRDAGAPAGVAALLVYPMNALVNDQLKRLRLLLAGTGIPFARYTGETPAKAVDNVPQLDQMREFTPQELEAHQAGRELPLPWEERYSREEIRAAHPRILLTNYNQLEYLLLRHEDLDLFDGAPLRYLVMDEVHTYTGALGSEVACLLRRLRYLTGKGPSDVLCVGTSATVQDPSNRIDGATAVRNFSHRLFGIPEESIEVVEEQYQALRPLPEDAYEPPPPDDPQATLADVLSACREVHLQDEVTQIPDTVLQAAERLCGRPSPAGEDNRARLFDLLAANHLVRHLERAHDGPRLLEDTLQGLRQMGKSCTATCLEPFKEFSRPAAIALREFAPPSRIYADGNVFRITRIALHDPWEKVSESSPYKATREFSLDPQSGRLLDPAGRTEEGGTDEEKLRSVSLAGADIDTREAIGDIRDNRVHGGYDVRPMLLAEHGGGWQAKVGDHTL